MTIKVLAAAILFSSGAVLAQEINPSWYIQPSINVIEPDSEFGTDERDYGGAIRFGKPVAEMWDVQIGASHARAEEGAFMYRQSLVGADALLMMSRKKFRPFVMFGVGAQRDKVENPLRRVHETSPYVSAGLGFQLGLSNQWAMQADLRTVRGRLRHDEDFGFDRSNNKYLTIGLNYAFNKPAAPPPPPQPVVEQPAPPPPAPVPPPPARALRSCSISSARCGR